jgi:hypothetical protein
VHWIKLTRDKEKLFGRQYRKLVPIKCVEYLA